MKSVWKRVVGRSLLLALAGMLTSPLLAAAPPDDARAAEALARSKDCFYCHSDDKPGLAPPFRDVARRYNGLENADLMVAERIKYGGGDVGGLPHWGNAAMPSSAARVPVNDAEARTLAHWVLSQHR